jgi:hypothetical protein
MMVPETAEVGHAGGRARGRPIKLISETVPLIREVIA